MTWRVSYGATVEMCFSDNLDTLVVIDNVSEGISVNIHNKPLSCREAFSHKGLSAACIQSCER